MKRLVVVSSALALLSFCGGCSSSSSNGGGGGNKIAVSISPGGPVQLFAAQTQQFTATVTGTSNTAVTWSVAGGGTIDSSGKYTAPSAVSSQTQVTVTAQSQADTTKSAKATVTLLVITITISPSSVQLGGAQTKQFSASVTGATNKAVTWSVTGGGSIDSSGNYTAPSVVSTQMQATVVAQSQADSTLSASVNVTLMPIAVTMSPTTLTFGLPGRDAFNAVVQWTNNKSVTWSLSPTTNSGTILDGFYTTPASWTPPTQVQVTVTSRADPSRSASATVTLSSPGLLAGQYAFFSQGNDSSGMIQETGSITVDPANHTVTGVEDIVQLSGAHTSVQLNGNYTPVSSTGRGTMTFTDTLHRTRVFNFNHTAEMTRVHFTAGDSGDTSGIRGVGLMEFQDATAFSASSTAGDFAFGVSGSNVAGGRVGAVGRFHLDGANTLSNGVIDLNNAGSMTTNSPFAGGAYSTPDATGRGTAVINGLNMVYYAISTNEYLLMTMDTPTASIPLLGGRAFRESGGPFNAASLAFGPTPDDSVFYLVGTPNGVTDSSDVAAGFLTSDGTSTVTITQMDENSGGNISSALTPSGPYTVDASGDGRATIQLTGYRDLILYFVSPDTAFLLDDNTRTLGANVGVGYMEPQTLQNCSCTTLTGNYVWGSVSQATTQDGVESGGFTYSIGKFNPANADISEPSSYQPNQPYRANAQNIVSSGRGTFTRTWTSPVAPEISPENFVLYLIARDRGIAFSTQSTQKNPVLGQIEK